MTRPITRKLALILLLCPAFPAQTPLPSSCIVTGDVKDTGGSPVHGGIVKLFDQSALHHASAGISTEQQQQGRFTLPAVPCGDKYILRVESAGHQPLVYKDLSLRHTTTDLDLVLYPWTWYADQKLITALVVVFYLLSILFFRWHNIAIFDQKLFQAESASTKVRLEIESDSAPDVQLKIKPLLGMLTDAGKPFDHFSFLSWMFWTRGDEISSWTRLREVQRQMVSLWPPDSLERLRARLESVQQDLRQANQPATAAIADLLQDALAKPPDFERWKQLLGEAMGVLYCSREEDFQRLTTWQSKSTWLALIGCLLIQASVSAKGGAMLMLMGAAGGLMSRLMRALHATNEPADYGASWTTLFLSPLLGALSAWYGVLLVTGFTTLKILNPDLASQISFDEQMSLATLALAFLLGFSERLFDGLIKSAEQKILAPDQAASQMTVSSVSSPATDVREVKPSRPNPGDAVIIFGTMLDQANVDGIKLTARDTHKDFPLAIKKQDSTSIAFDLPKDVPLGKYTLTVMAKNSANVSVSFQIGEDPKPPTSLAAPSASSFKPNHPVIFPGTSLDQVSIAKVELLDDKGQSSVPASLRYSPQALSFSAPAAPGQYTLKVTPKGAPAIQQEFTVVS